MPPKPSLWTEKFPNYRKVAIPDDLKIKLEKEKRHRWS
jgi:hypothetical protein